MNLTPNATSASTGALTGASVHAALSDSSDTTYVTYDYGEHSTVSFSDLSLPSGAQLVSAQLFVRCAKNGTGPGVLYAALVADTSTFSTGSVTWESPQVMGSAFQFGGLTDAGLDAAAATWTCVSLSQVILYELAVRVLYLTKPVVDVLSPTGTIATNKALVSWSSTFDPDATSSPTFYDVKVFSSAQYSAPGFDPATSQAACSSGVQHGPGASWQFQERLPDGNYRAYVRVAADNAPDLWSDWSYEAFTVSAALPGQPYLFTPTTLDSHVPGGVRLKIWGSAGAATTNGFEVQRESGDGFVPVRTPSGDGYVPFVAGHVSVFDFESPNEVPCTYRVRSVNTANATVSDWYEVTGSWTSDRAWLKCIDDPTLSVSLTARSYEGFQVAANQGTFRVLGSSKATVVQDVPGPETGQVVFLTDTDEDRKKLTVLLERGSPVLLQVAGHPDRIVAIGDRSSTRIVDKSWLPYHDDSLAWTVVDDAGTPIGVGLWSYPQVVLGSGCEGFWSLGNVAGTTDLSGYSRSATALGGVAVGGVSGPLAANDENATTFDGTNDRFGTLYKSRRNLWTNPSFETNVTGVSGFNANIAQSTSQAYDGSNSCRLTATGAGALITADHTAGIAATAGTTYTLSYYLYTTVSGRQGGADLVFFNAGGTQIGSAYAGTYSTTSAGSWVRYSVTATAPANTAFVGFNLRSDAAYTGSSSEVSYIDGILLEKSSTVASFFPTVSQLHTGEAGWLGTAHASASDVGCFANGTSRTFMGWGYRSHTGSAHALLGSSDTCALRFDAGSNKVQWFPDTGDTGAEWNFWPGNTQWVHWALTFNEVTDTATLYLNGETQGDKAVTAKYKGPTDLFIGGRGNSGTADPFNGRLAWVSVHLQALSATQIRAAYDAGKGLETFGPFST